MSAAWAWFIAFVVQAGAFVLVSHDVALWRKRAEGYKHELTEVMRCHGAVLVGLQAMGIRVRCDVVSTDDLEAAASPADISWITKPGSRLPGQRRPGDAS